MNSTLFMINDIKNTTSKELSELYSDKILYESAIIKLNDNYLSQKQIHKLDYIKNNQHKSVIDIVTKLLLFAGINDIYDISQLIKIIHTNIEYTTYQDIISHIIHDITQALDECNECINMSNQLLFKLNNGYNKL